MVLLLARAAQPGKLALDHLTLHLTSVRFEQAKQLLYVGMERVKISFSLTNTHGRPWRYGEICVAIINRTNGDHYYTRQGRQIRELLCGG